MTARAERRHHRRRIVARRRSLARRIFRYDLAETPRGAGRLARWNMVCSCGLCRAEKWRDRRPAERARERDEIELQTGG